MEGFLGVDIGSISTKAVVIDKDNNILAKKYLWTEGDPINAVKRLLEDIEKQIKDKDIEIVGTGTTGSARELIGRILNATIVKNEITANAIGTLTLHPDVRTIFEIGGQDSKIIILNNGVVVDYAMNTLCIAEGTNITTEDYSPEYINEIKIGQKILTHKGKFQETEQVFERDYKGDMIKMEISNSKKLEITPQHSILALKRGHIKCYQSYSRGNLSICKPLEERSCNKKCTRWKNFSWEPKFILAKELKKGDFIAAPLPSKIEQTPLISYSKVNEKQLKPIKKRIDNFPINSDLFILLGYYLAEGSISYNRSRNDKKIKYPSGVQFVLNINEENYVKDICRIVTQNFPDLNIRIDRYPKKNTIIIVVHSKVLAQYIKFLCGSYADKKRLSSELLNLEPILQKNILKGFFRGDGQLRKRPKNALGKNKMGNRYVASTISKILAHQLYWLLLRNKIKCTIRKSSQKTKGGKYVYFISIHGKDINKLENRTLVNPKKQGYKSFIYKNWLFEPIKKIKKYNFQGKVYNLKVKNDHSYIANFCGVSNCAAGTGSFLSSQARRLDIPIEDFGEYALKAKAATKIAGRCTVFSESDMVHKAQIGHAKENIIAGLCRAIVNNYLNNVGKGKDIQPPIVFQGGVSKNIGVVEAFKEVTGNKIIVDKNGHLMGAFGAAILALKNPTRRKFNFDVKDIQFETKGIDCSGCANNCEIVCVLKNGVFLDGWGNRCAVGIERTKKVLSREILRTNT